MMLFRQSLRYKINFSIALVLLIVTLVFGAVLTVFEIKRRNAAIEQIELSLNDLTTQYREQLGNEIFAEQTAAIRATLADIMKRESVLAITTFNESGKVLVSSDASEQENLSEKQVAALRLGTHSTLQNWEESPILTFTSPIKAYGEEVGFWQVRYSLATLERQTLEIIIIFVTSIFSLALLIGLLLNSILERFVLSPVNMLRHAMKHIQGSDTEIDRESGRAVRPQRLEKMMEAFDELPDDLVFSGTGGDEIGSLAHSFGQMLFALKSAYVGIDTDALTGLNSRRRIDEALKDEVNRAQRYQGAFSIILLDIDNFKEINDNFGHLVGDEVLKKISLLLKTLLRKTDIAGRWGGEEFLVILPQQTKVQAGAAGEKLRRTIEQTDLRSVGKITSSFGVTEFLPDDTPESLISRADEALYRSKRLGKNRVELS